MLLGGLGRWGIEIHCWVFLPWMSQDHANSCLAAAFGGAAEAARWRQLRVEEPAGASTLNVTPRRGGGRVSVPLGYREVQHPDLAVVRPKVGLHAWTVTTSRGCPSQ